MYHFCTLFDSNYLLRGLTLFRSLDQHTANFQFYVLCLDEKCYATLNQLAIDNIHPIDLNEIEYWDQRLLGAKQSRSRVEYYFTLSPALPLFLLKTRPNIDIITYMDADLYFYQSPKAIYQAFSNHSILIIEHRFPQHLQEKEIYGRFNVQYQSFRNNLPGLDCLENWHQQCLNWCYDRLEDDKFADQKYLNAWPKRYNNQELLILQHKGAGVAPWNWAKYPLNQKNHQMFIDDDPLIFYHFHAIKILHHCFISHGLADFGIMPRTHLKWFYCGYIRQLKKTHQWLITKGIQDYKIVDKKIHFRTNHKQKKLDFFKEILRKIWTQIMFVC